MECCGYQYDVPAYRMFYKGDETEAYNTEMYIFKRVFKFKTRFLVNNKYNILIVLK